MSGRGESYGDSRVAGSSQAFSFLHAGDGRALNPQQRSSFPFCGDGSKEQLLTRLNDPDLQYVHSSQSAITTTLSIGTDTPREMDGGNLYSAGCWSWGPKIDCAAEAPRGGRGQATSSGGKRKRAGKGSALKEDLGSSLVLGQGSSPIDIRPSQGAASFSGGNFCFDIDSPTALSLGQMDPISESPDSQGSFLGSSVRSRASDGFLSIGSGCDGLLFSQLDCNQSRESRDSGAVYNQPGVDYNLNSGVQLQLGQRGNLGESVTRGGRSFEGTRRGGLSRHMEKGPGFILELGSMGNASGQSREGQNLSSMRESQSQSGMLLELGLSENVLDNRDSVRASGGPVPVLDEGSSSARWSNSGGFMPSLLMGSPHLRPTCSQLHGEHLPKVPRPAEPVLECHLNRVEQELPMSMRASTSCATSTTSACAPLSEKVSKVCKFRGCGKGARGASGLCIAHGGGRRCEKQGCNKGAEGRTVYCKAHGGGRRCQKLGCTKSAEGKTDYCIGHGGGRRCSSEGCSKAARGRSGLCIRHGGGKRCQIEGCTKSAEGYSGLCISHGGGRRCQSQGCTKGAQGSTMFCKAHGGGKRCMIAGCNKGAEGSTPLCKGHGGGKRCMHEGGGICSKSVHGGTAFCVAHGGGKRCAVEGCSKSARGRTDHCVRHGGGKRCKFEACGKSAQGSTDFCKAHGGGKRCQWGVEGSPFFAYASDGVSWAGGTLKPEPCERFARGKTGLCAAHSGLVHDTRVHAGSVICPGLSPGLFRGLVPGSALAKGTADPSGSTTGLTETASGDSEMRDFGESGIDSSEDDLSGMETANANSWAPPITGATESALDSGLSVVGSALGASSRSLPEGTSSMTGALVTPSAALLSVSSGSYPTSQSPLLGSLIPPKVLVPLSMQKLGAADITSSSQGRLGEVLTSRTSDDGAFNMNSLSLPEGRVHGGGLMEMLARDPGIGNKIDQHLNASKVSSQHHWQSGALFSPADESP